MNTSLEFRANFTDQLFLFLQTLLKAQQENPVKISHFLTISLGSAFELETQLIIAEECELATHEKLQELISRTQLLQKQITAFSNTIYNL